LDPIYFGDYPEVMHERLGDRLPKFSEEDRELIRNAIDFVGLNHYTTRFIAHVTDSPEEGDFYKAQEMERIGKHCHYLVFHTVISEL
jgi:beta-glucosidase